MTADFLLHVCDWDEDYMSPQSVELTEAEAAELRAITPEAIIAYLRDHCVGRCNTVSGQEKYFIPVMQFGTLRASLQVNYYVWRDRDDRDADHEAVITADEFQAVCKGPESVLDVAFSLDGRRISLGQMRVREVAEFFNALVSDQDEPCAILDSRP